MMLPRVLLADDHGIFAEGLQRLLSGHAEVVGRLDRADDLEGESGRVHPDVILLDLSMPGIGGLEALRSLKAARHPAKVIILTMHADPRLAAECLKAGAAGFVLKQSSGDELVAAIQEVMQGHTYLTPRLMERLQQETRAVARSIKDPAETKLQYGKDGSLTLYFADARPKDAPDGNWLPTPKGQAYSLTFRFYRPKGGVADLSYFPPALVKQ